MWSSHDRAAFTVMHVFPTVPQRSWQAAGIGSAGGGSNGGGFHGGGFDGGKLDVIFEKRQDASPERNFKLKFTAALAPQNQD